MKRYSDIAQLVEQVTVHHLVPGSSPGVGAICTKITRKIELNYESSIKEIVGSDIQSLQVGSENRDRFTPPHDGKSPRKT